MSKQPIVFFGTPEICLPFLEVLHQAFDIRLIVTQPDAFGGRNRKKRIVPAAKIFAEEHGIEVIQPETLKDEDVIEHIRQTEPVIGVVVSYGQLIPKRVFRIPVHRTVNVHFSLLPRYRGAAPVQRALQNGDETSGITIFEIVKKLDAGDIWATKEMDIGPHDNTQDLWDRMSKESAGFLIETLHGIIGGKLTKTPQDHSLATHAPAVCKEEGCIDWTLTARELYNRFRAFTPWPGLYCNTCEKRFRLTEIRVCSLTHDKKPGDVLSMDKKCLKICCGDHTVLEVTRLQPQGKKPMTPFCYCQGNQLPECFD